MTGSRIAAEIDKEYRIKEFYKKIQDKRQKCKDKKCEECKFKQICTSYNE